MLVGDQKLEVGDFVIISSAYGMDYGWFVGSGKSGTLQYRSMNHLSHWQKMIEQGHSGPKKVYISYINTVSKYRVLKVKNPNELFASEELQEQYEAALKYLNNENFFKS